MGIFVKSSGTGNWSSVKKIYVKTSSSGWSSVKKIYVKAATNTWRIFWPSSGPQPTTDPYFSTDSAGNTSYTNPYVRIGSSLYGNNGAWDNTGFTGVSYAYQVQTYPLLNSGTATVISSGTYTIPVSISISTSGYSGTSSWAGKYLDFQITDNNSQSEPSTDFASNTGGRLWVITNPPSNTSASFNSFVNFSPGNILTYTGIWNGAEAYSPDSTRSSVTWYKSSNVYTTVSQITSNATMISSSLVSTTYSSGATTFTTSSSYTTSTSDANNYFYVVESEQNSGTDYAATGAVQVFAKSQLLNYPPVVQTYPTLTAVSPAGTYGKSNSFTVGATITVNNGTWSPTPTSVYSGAVFNSTNSGAQSGWTSLYTTPNLISTTFYTDSSQNTSHSFTLGANLYYTSNNGQSFSYVPAAGYYLGYAVNAYNGASESLEADATAQLIYPAPTTITNLTFQYNSPTSVGLSWTAGSNYSYSVQSSSDNISWTTLSTGITTTSYLAPVANNTTTYFRILSYNADGVYVISSSYQYKNYNESFSFGNTIYVGTNGYISFDTPNTTSTISLTSGNVFAFLPYDLVLDYISYASVYSTADNMNYWVILWQGHRYSGSTGTAEIQIEIWLPAGSSWNNTNSVYVKYLKMPGSGFAVTPGYYYNGALINGGTTTPVTGTVAQYNLSNRTFSVNLPQFSYQSTGWAGWLGTTSGVSGGSADDGYNTQNTFAASYPSAPQSVSYSSVGTTTATVSWSPPANNGGTNIQYYTYSLNGASEVNIGNVTSQNFINLNPGTTYTVDIRAYNYSTPNGSNNNNGSTSFTTTQQYTVTYSDSVDSASGSAVVNAGSSVTLPTPSSVGGYYFNGWYTASSGGIRLGSGGNSYTPSSSITLYAQWSSLYSVYWYEENPSAEVTTTQSTPGVSVTGPTVSYSGYTFNGWWTASSGGSVVSYSNPYTFSPTSSESLYAQWIQAAPGTPSVSYVSSTTSSIRINITESGTGSYGYVYYSTNYWSSNSAIQSYASYAGQVTGNGGFTVSGLASSTTYYIYVIPYNSSGVAGNFGYTTGTTSTAVVAYPPYALSSVSAFSSGSPLTFSASWTAPSTDSTHGAATGYHFYVQAGNSSAGPFSNVSTTISSPYPSIANTSNTSISGTVTTSGSWSWIRVYVEPYNSYGSAPNYVGGVG